ncbi:hypothetical protein [Citrobacter werkmanii]|uniref:hypothetical protein n=1 Tax=Citrobacter werkmanii TaxID=67827 RepID=UPI001D09BD80|nr:hypothetical protein [Citrobacter werkmanii]MBY6254284.1 hypothetical protein [Citrobacter werkmanii]
MPRADALELLDEVEENLEVMEASQNLKPVKIKGILEHLRSSLEYVANDTYDIYNHHPNLSRPKIYFPYGKRELVDKFFKTKIGLSDLEHSEIYHIYNSIQGFSTGEEWLDMMCKLTNDAKHRKPISLKEETSSEITVSANGFNLLKASNQSTVTIKNITVDGIKYSDFHLENGVLNVAGNGSPLSFTLTEDKKIKFHGEEYEVIPFLKKCLANINVFVNSAYGALEKIETT